MASKKDFSNEIRAYALRNALDFGRVDTGKILPKLFQHGLEKNDIASVMPTIKKIVQEVNSLSAEDRVREFEGLSKYVKEREEREGLAELTNVGKKFVARVAPFPSGALHIGNAKTFILNALYAEKYKGKIFLVMDDTIGSAEKPIEKEAYELIEKGFKWLGIKFDEKFYKSDRLEIYYKYALELIKKGKAYVCYCDREEMKKNREAERECGCRHFPSGVQSVRWEEMFDMKEGQATLRLKTGMQHPNPAFRDRVLFKISDREHPRVGAKYRVWPTLEMSWAVDDYLLKITHVIRGNDLMIESDMERFIWEIFGWKGPEIIHTGFVNIEGAGISKSKSRKEVKSGKFLGWDDPRTWSIQSLARRGIKQEALKEFVKEIGLNKQDITLPVESLYSHNRSIIDASSDRYSFIVNPVKLKISGTPKSISVVNVPVHPDKKKTRAVKIKDVCISRDDFEKFKGKEVRLSHLFNLKISNSGDGEFVSLANKDVKRINWVSDSVKARVLMPDGKWVSGVAEAGVKELEVGSVIQFERFGFARFDGFRDGEYEFWFTHK